MQIKLTKKQEKKYKDALKGIDEVKDNEYTPHIPAKKLFKKVLNIIANAKKIQNIDTELPTKEIADDAIGILELIADEVKE